MSENIDTKEAALTLFMAEKFGLAAPIADRHRALHPVTEVLLLNGRRPGNKDAHEMWEDEVDNAPEQRNAHSVRYSCCFHPRTVNSLRNVSGPELRVTCKDVTCSEVGVNKEKRIFFLNSLFMCILQAYTMKAESSSRVAHSRSGMKSRVCLYQNRKIEKKKIQFPFPVKMNLSLTKAPRKCKHEERFLFLFL